MAQLSSVSTLLNGQFSRFEPDAAATINYRAEVMRKMVHLCSLSIPVIYYYIPRTTGLMILIPLAVFSLTTDWLRHRHPLVADKFYFFFRFMLRKHELDAKTKQLTGATYLLLSAVFCVLVFPKVIVVNAFSVLIVSDITSALIGRKFGRHRFMSKSLEGSLAFFVSAVVVILIAPKAQGLAIEYALTTVAVLFGAVAEAASVSIDDNISIPLSVGGMMWLLYAVFLPSVDLFALK